MASRIRALGQQRVQRDRDHIAKHHPTELTYDNDVEAFKHIKATAVPPVIVHAGSDGGATTLAAGLQSMSALMS